MRNTSVLLGVLLTGVVWPLPGAETPAQAWVQRYSGPTNDWFWPVAAAADASNNVVVTASSYGGQSGDDYVTIKYSSEGTPLWTNRYNGLANRDDLASAVAVDASNNVIVTGSSWGGGSAWDGVTIKYSSEGTPLWTNRYNGPANANDFGRTIAVDGSNNVIVTGRSWGGGTGYDYATFKYSSAGVPLWTQRYNGPGNGYDYPYAMAVDASNNVIVTGFSVGSGSGYDYATIKYSSAGVPLWTQRYNGRQCDRHGRFDRECNHQ